ncbi:MAG: tripartite tricarboxylate transporter substrate binding protein [Betaproteobacteria bacterium]|nr:tripartite tricarboxylate transporter substrate binding protein [Betaproteobacteria bacterium]
MNVAHKLGLAFALAIATACGESAAQTYPNKPLKFVVGFPPGGGTDLIARIVAERLSERLGQPIVVENKPGADAIIATEYVAKSAPDGYTLLAASSGAMTFSPGMYDRLPYDTVKDFAAITQLVTYPILVVAHPSVPANSIKELIALAKAKPGSLFFAGGAPPFRMTMELFKKQAGVDMVYVPYKGTGPTIAAAVAGEVAIAAIDMAPALPQLKAGKLRALAVTGPKRSSVVPGVPTMAESGLPNFEVVIWTSLFAPAGTPRAIIDKLYGEVTAVLKTESVKARFASLSYDPGGMPPEQFAATVKADRDKWTRVAKEANIRAQ